MKLLSTLKAWFGPARGSMRGYLDAQELSRVVLTSILAGVSVQEILGVIAGDAGSAFAPGDVSLAVAVVTLIAEIYRRLDHGVATCSQAVGSPRVVRK